MSDNEMKDTDKIKNIITDDNGRVLSVELKDGEKFSFKEFMDLFKNKLQTIVAGEIISWDDEWRYQRQIDPKTMEQYLDVVEAEGLVANTKYNLTQGQKVSIGVIIILIFAMAVGAKILGVV